MTAYGASLAGGLLIGLSAALLLVLNGRVAGISGIVGRLAQEAVEQPVALEVVGRPQEALVGDLERELESTRALELPRHDRASAAARSLSTSASPRADNARTRASTSDAGAGRTVVLLGVGWSVGMSLAGGLLVVLAVRHWGAGLLRGWGDTAAYLAQKVRGR